MTKYYIETTDGRIFETIEYENDVSGNVYNINYLNQALTDSDYLWYLLTEHQTGTQTAAEANWFFVIVDEWNDEGNIPFDDVRQLWVEK